jgi:uncharacterized ParB-like nuclease family protein
VRIPLEAVLDSRYKVHEEIVQEYMSMINEGVEFEPIWVQMGKRMKDGKINIFQHKKILAVDGNHRLHAYKRLGHTHINAVAPNSHLPLMRALYG